MAAVLELLIFTAVDEDVKGDVFGVSEAAMLRNGRGI